ncbi:GNAT family N-acetyltransferase [Phytoactinopolyspora endophytica]|uniref:GNAT family N-acetyltransferase n=1 Tax=Phytoactinopolyspora endophytica TaxID=1642495 RepID=UPI001F0F08BF|nr:GNAT family N-acetyltransferase [Phytoactinopolyspora endophytica]
MLNVARFDDLSAGTLYALLRLRVDVFVVEQHCAYPELDGRDTEPGTRHIWYEREGAPVAYLRLLTDADGTPRIGRVVVAAHARGAGLADRLIQVALDQVGERPCVLDAQAHLVDLYSRHGFVVVGEEYLDDGIPHLPMARPAAPHV